MLKFAFIMRPSPEFIVEHYKAFNQQIFAGQLPMPHLRLTDAKTYIGNMRCRKKRTFTGLTMNYDFVMSFSITHDMPQAEWEDTIIHEMIHYYIYFNNLHDDAPHGTLFRKWMDTINERLGRHIAISHRADREESLQARKEKMARIREHFVCISRLDDGKLGCTVCPRTRLFEFRRSFEQFFRIKSMRWFATLDPFFNRYPHVTTPKIYAITQKDIDEHLADATELVYRNRMFVAKQ